MRLYLSIALALASAACGLPADPAPADQPVNWRVLTPSAELAEVTQEAADRWNTTTGCYPESGCEFVLRDGGIPVSRVHQIPVVDADGVQLRHANGELRWADGVAWTKLPSGSVTGVELREGLTADEVILTLTHELGHVRGIFEHTDTGITQDGGNKSKGVQPKIINEEVLEATCTAKPCLGFSPETSYAPAR